MGVHKDRYKFHDPSGRGSGWGATEVGGPAFFCGHVLSSLPAVLVSF